MLQVVFCTGIDTITNEMLLRLTLFGLHRYR